MSLSSWKNRQTRDPSYEIKRSIAKDAYYANAWIYNSENDKKIESLANADVFLIRSNGSIEQVAVGEPDGSSDAAGIDLATQPEAGPPMHKKPPLPHFVRKALARIPREITASGKNDRTIRVIDPKERAVPVFSLPVAVDEDGEVLPELLFSDEGGRVRQRRACFAEVIERGVALRQLAIIEEQNAQSAALVVQVREASIHYLTQSLLKHLSMITKFPISSVR